MHLLLKSSAQANAISTELMAKGRHLERDNNHTTGWTHFMSDLNLAYVDYICSKPAHLILSLLQVSPLAAMCTDYMHEFLQYKDYPPSGALLDGRVSTYQEESTLGNGGHHF